MIRTPEQRAIMEAAREIRRQESQERKAKRAPREARTTRPKAPADDGAAYMAWQHAEGIACVACLIEGAPGPTMLRGEVNPIEVAHQKRNAADPTWRSNQLGKRVPHKQSVPLCRWHHQLAPNACDKGQAKFWDRIGVSVIDYCRALHAAFKAQAPGEPIARLYARGAARGTARDDDRVVGGSDQKSHAYTGEGR